VRGFEFTQQDETRKTGENKTREKYEAKCLKFSVFVVIIDRTALSSGCVARQNAVKYCKTKEDKKNSFYEERSQETQVEVMNLRIRPLLW
jgi:hypothetical protein